MNALHRHLRRVLPRALRVEWVRLRRMPVWLVERSRMAQRPGHLPVCEYTLAHHCSPIVRPGTEPDVALQAGKAKNIRAVVRALDGAVIAPFQVLSYHHLVGRPGRRKGMAAGMELHDERPVKGIGGGACKVSNLLYLLALRGGMRVVERHRHALDIFPDTQRTVPFGCGATVYYNRCDLRFENPFDQPVHLDLKIIDGPTGPMVNGWLRCARDPGVRFEIVERDHRFTERNGGWWRENRIVRRVLDPAGALLAEFTVAENRGRTLYMPFAALVDASTAPRVAQ
ncbi:MAG: vancomycin resistance protein VanW [Bradymonadia bacterium]|jgi:vancomycin resistance protein VanW